jgi:mono/diheme cytochrome c family protein
MRRPVVGLLIVAGAVTFATAPWSLQPVSAQQSARAADAASHRAVLDKYCVTCHSDRLRTGELSLQSLDLTDLGSHAAVWEKVVRKLRASSMPPVGFPRPENATYAAVAGFLETGLDEAIAAKPNPGRPAAFHRLNRTEYRHAIRDLLALDVDVGSLLPPDAASYGFDNIGEVLGLSPVLLERYLSAARKISRLAVGNPAIPPSTETYRVPSDLTQDDHLDGLPWGTRGGTLVQHHFALDGEYVLKLRLARESVADMISDLSEPTQIAITLDGDRVATLTIGEELATRKDAGRGGARGGGGLMGDEYLRTADEKLQARFAATGGTHAVGVAFVKRTSAEIETVRKPFRRAAPENGDSHGQPYLSTVTVAGPFNPAGPGDTASRRRIFECRPAAATQEARCAKKILSTLAHRAYRRPVATDELQDLLAFYQEGRAAGSFEAGIELALNRLLVSPSFLFRIELDPREAAAGTPYRISDLDLASRLSFFLWSSIPDDRLLDLAERGKLRDPVVLEKEVRRMLADPKSAALITNFAGQWLYLRNVGAVLPDRRLFPDFDENLRRAFKRETELFFESIVREDHSVLDLLTADYTFLNERLARHYGIPDIYGDHFRRVALADANRRGLLGQGSILTVRSYPNRTSPVLRGVWILENILGTPPPPPPPNVPDLKDKDATGHVLSMRERMALHRENPACGVRHARMDPLGLSMENFDAIGRWRTRSESEGAIDASGGLPDGTTFEGVAGLRGALLKHSGEFVGTLTEKLLTYALGRGLEYYDAPVIRRIGRAAAKNEHRFSAIILGIVNSQPFLMRKSADAAEQPSAVTAATILQ